MGLCERTTNHNTKGRMMAKQTDTSRGTLELVLADGKSLETQSGFELACFLESRGRSIVPPQKGGKSKGARTRGKQVAKKVA